MPHLRLLQRGCSAAGVAKRTAHACGQAQPRLAAKRRLLLPRCHTNTSHLTAAAFLSSLTQPHTDLHERARDGGGGHGDRPAGDCLQGAAREEDPLCHPVRTKLRAAGVLRRAAAGAWGKGVAAAQAAVRCRRSRAVAALAGRRAASDSAQATLRLPPPDVPANGPTLLSCSRYLPDSSYEDWSLSELIIPER